MVKLYKFLEDIMISKNLESLLDKEYKNIIYMDLLYPRYQVETYI